MNTSHTTLTIQEHNLLAAKRQPGDFAVIYRLVAAELWIIRRRLLTKMLLATAVGILLLYALGIGLNTVNLANTPASSFVLRFCPAHVQDEGCVTHVPTLADQQHYKALRVLHSASNVALPGALATFGGQIVIGLLFLLMVLLAGSLLGSDYTLGTVRLLFTRGPTRLQCLGAKLATLLLCSFIAVPLLIVLGVTLGAAIYPLSGLSMDWSFLTAAWWGQALLYLLVGVLAWMVYAVMAGFFATLGRSTVVGAVAPFVWFVGEQVLQLFLGSVGGSGPFTDLVKAIPDYLVSSSIGALLKNQGHTIYGGGLARLSNLHALVVLAVYLIIFIALSCWLTVRRDVTD